MKKQQIAGVVLAAVLVLGIAMFAGYQSTRYPRTIQAANQAVQAGQEAEAVALYEKAVNVSPGKAEAYLALAEIYEKHAQHADAVSVLKKAAEAIPGKSGEAAKIREKLEELNPTVTASQESGTYQDPVELKLESKSGKEIRYELSEAPDSTDSAPQSYTEPLTFRRNGTYRIKCYAMNQSGEAGDPTELNFTIQLDPEKYHMNSWYQGKDGGWYYNNDAGEPVIGWRLIDNNWYYFADNGRMKTGWMQLDGKYYYLDDNGVIANGWRQFDGRYYYFLSDGSMAANQWVDGAYYVGADGVMLVSTTTPDGNQVDASGKKIEKSRNEKAVEAYRQILRDGSWKDSKYSEGVFGVIDINGDGVLEAFALAGNHYEMETPTEKNESTLKIFYYTDKLQAEEMENVAEAVFYIPSRKQLMIPFESGGRDWSEVFELNGNQQGHLIEDSYIDNGKLRELEGKNPDTLSEGERKQLQEYRRRDQQYYRVPRHNLNTVEINPENLDRYLQGNGKETGYFD